jgi:hypothetical protein
MDRRVARRATAPEVQPQDRTPTLDETSADADRLSMLKWHLDRYDRLRSSTVTRASVVLSAGAILSAGNAVLLGQVLGSSAAWLDRWAWLLAITVATMATALLVVASVITAAGVLLTGRRSRDVFTAVRDIPVGLIFNGSDTIKNVKDFAGFRAATHQSAQEMADAAEVDLWVCIHQHRHRYGRLRLAVRLLRWAAVAFLLILLIVLTANFAYAL